MESFGSSRLRICNFNTKLNSRSLLSLESSNPNFFASFIVNVDESLSSSVFRDSEKIERSLSYRLKNNKSFVCSLRGQRRISKQPFTDSRQFGPVHTDHKIHGGTTNQSQVKLGPGDCKQTRPSRRDQVFHSYMGTPTKTKRVNLTRIDLDSRVLHFELEASQSSLDCEAELNKKLRLELPNQGERTY